MVAMGVCCAGILALVVVLAGCGPASAPVRTQEDPHWLLLESPATAEYPQGAAFAPIERWSRLAEYASEDKCQASLVYNQDRLQRAVTCVASDDPRLTRK